MNTPHASTPVLVAEQITKRFYDPIALDILKGISFTLSSGQSAAIVGKSGEGKTTFLHILGTIDEPTTGSIEIAGELVTHKNRDAIRCKHIGFIFQAFHLLADSTVIENVLIPVKIARMATHKASPAYQRACDLLKLVGLEDRMHFPVNKLSGGERQRVAIARAFINDPHLILADEPTGNLDHETAEEIQALLLHCVQIEKKALLVVTHNLKLASKLDACYELEDGYLKKL